VNRRQLHRIPASAEGNGGRFFSGLPVAGDHADRHPQGFQGLRGVLRKPQQNRVDPLGRQGFRGFLDAAFQVFKAEACALDDGGHDGGIDAELSQPDVIVRLIAALSIGRPAAMDADDAVMTRQPGELEQNGRELLESVLFGTDPFPVLDIPEAGIQQIEHFHEQDPLPVQLLRPGAVGRRCGSRFGLLQAGAEFLQEFGGDFVHLLNFTGFMLQSQRAQIATKIFLL